MTLTYNPFDPNVKADPYPYYAALRKHQPGPSHEPNTVTGDQP